MGKAKCANCHVPPNFTDFTYDNLGVPRNPLNPFYNEPAWNPAGAAWVDTGLGGFLKTAGILRRFTWLNGASTRSPPCATWTSGRIRASSRPTVTTAYFKSLEEIVHFYNTRDVPGGGMAVARSGREHHTAEMGNLGLNHGEELAIVAFLSTLSDGYKGEVAGELPFAAMPFPKTLRAAAPGCPEPDWGWRLTAFIQCGKYQIRIYRRLRCCRPNAA